jgi:hypothetical protein
MEAMKQTDLNLGEALDARAILGGTIAGIFDLLEICGEEVERAGFEVGHDLWMLLAPGDAFRGTAVIVYRSHVRELLARAKAGTRLDLGTDAEVLLGMREASLVAPLARRGTMLYHAAFRSVMSEATYRELLGDLHLPQEQWKGQLDELWTEARRKVRTGRPMKLAA